MKAIGQLSHDGIGRKTRVKCHQSLVGFDPSFVSKIGPSIDSQSKSVFRSPPFVGFVFVVDKSYVRRRWLLTSVKRSLF